MKKIILLLTFLLYPALLFSQDRPKTKIVEILDSNLFLTEEGQLLKLANVECPSIHSKNARFAGMVVLYAKEKILNHSLYYEKEKNSERNDTLSIHLFEKYMLTTVCFNKEYLRYGFGKFIQTSDSTYAKIYLKAEQEAKISGKGLWETNILSFKSIQLRYSGSIVFESRYNTPSLLKLTYEKITNRNRTQLTLFKIFREQESSNLFIQLKYDFYSKYIGLKFGATYFSFGDYEGPHIFLLPVLGLKLGYIKKLYVSFDFCDDVTMGFFEFNLNYNFGYPYGKIVLGTVKYDNEKFHMFKLQFDLFDSVVFDIRGKYNFNEDYGSFTGGIGFLF